jgi:hypothetical protein
VRRLYTGYVNTDISGSALIRRGASSINLSAARVQQFPQSRKAPTRSPTIPTGELVEFRRKFNSYFTTSTPICPAAGRWNGRPTRRSGSTRAGRRASSTCSSATA